MDVPSSERRIVFLLAAVQFVNVLDFMMVMPLGPDFARALGIPSSRLGIVGGSYTAAAALAGMVGMLFLDRFDRRKALATAMLGLVLGTAAGGFARGSGELIAARILAGAFGGPATSLALSILTDVVPPARRGKAMGAVMGAFSVASVLGVPAGLELSRLGGWRLPFFAVAALGVLVVTAALLLMPALPARARQQTGGESPRGLRSFLLSPTTLLSLSCTSVVMMGVFAVVPNISAYFQFNVGYPRGRLGLLYLVGGIISFFAMRLAGAAVDRRGATVVGVVGSVLMVFDLASGFIHPVRGLPVMAIFVGLMLANSVRAVAMNALTSRVPPPSERARFMSAQSAVQHLSAALGAILSARILHERPGGGLEGMPAVAFVALVLSAMLPILMAKLSARLRPAGG